MGWQGEDFRTRDLHASFWRGLAASSPNSVKRDTSSGSHGCMKSKAMGARSTSYSPRPQVMAWLSIKAIDPVPFDPNPLPLRSSYSLFCPPGVRRLTGCPFLLLLDPVGCPPSFHGVVGPFLFKRLGAMGAWSGGRLWVFTASSRIRLQR